VDVTADDKPRILAFATKGAGSNEEDRLRALLANHQVDWFPFDRTKKRRAFRQLVALLKTRRYDLAVMEGTGLAGGLALIWSRLWRRCRYVVSSGDAVATWVASIRPLLRPAFAWYERVLCRRAAGFIGWTPYLVGRALSFGTRRAVTAPGWALHPKSPDEMAQSRTRLRAELGISDDTIVFGIVGSLAWNARVGFCYGWELVNAIRRIKRPDVAAIVVGDGAGLEPLRQAAGEDLNKRVFLTGGVPVERVLDSMAAFDVASLPQSVDGVGSFRYTTKISEYVAARLPVVLSQIPMAYDLGGGWTWRLPGSKPWGERYIGALADLMGRVTWTDVAEKRDRMPRALDVFDRDAQVARVTALIDDLLAETRGTR
jgi:glycosyltransferase involved in cell wall biosynthesis